MQTVAQEFVQTIGLPQDGEVELRTAAGSTAIHVLGKESVHPENNGEVVPKLRFEQEQNMEAN